MIKSKKVFYLFSSVLLVLISSCEENIFGPNEGNIKGTITNNHGIPIEGVVLSAKVIDGNNEDENSTINTATTDNNGNYILNDTQLGNIQVSTSYIGYREQIKSLNLTQDNDVKTIDFTLNGAPKFISSTQNTSVASISNNDTISFTVALTDDYSTNNDNFSYSVSAIVYNAENEVVKIYDLNSNNSQRTQLFDLQISAIDFTEGMYTINFEGTDNDNIKSNTLSKKFNIII
jgi:hypothetical protein